MRLTRVQANKIIEEDEVGLDIDTIIRKNWILNEMYGLPKFYKEKDRDVMVNLCDPDDGFMCSIKLSYLSMYQLNELVESKEIAQTKSKVDRYCSEYCVFEKKGCPKECPLR